MRMNYVGLKIAKLPPKQPQSAEYADGTSRLIECKMENALLLK